MFLLIYFSAYLKTSLVIDVSNTNQKMFIMQTAKLIVGLLANYTILSNLSMT